MASLGNRIPRKWNVINFNKLILFLALILEKYNTLCVSSVSVKTFLIIDQKISFDIIFCVLRLDGRVSLFPLVCLVTNYMVK